MTDQIPSHWMTEYGQENISLAGWLREILGPLATQNQTSAAPHLVSSHSDNQLELRLQKDYHSLYYQQLPDFIMALLHQDSQATLRYASLLAHLVGCQVCHAEYLDLYDALRAAIDPDGERPVFGQGTRTLAATPHRMLAHLCQSLISQAEAVLYQARHDHSDSDQQARELLQMALQISSHITQSTVRRQALQDLVRVATLFDGPTSPDQAETGVYSYTPALTGSARRGKVLRRSDTAARSLDQDWQVIEIQSRGLVGRIEQQGRQLILHLQDLDTAFRGRHLLISVLLGSLLEPVRWLGGNPRALRSQQPVADDGSLVTPLGESDLLLTTPEERNLLEAMFLLLEVRACD